MHPRGVGYKVAARRARERHGVCACRERSLTHFTATTCVVARAREYSSREERGFHARCKRRCARQGSTWERLCIGGFVRALAGLLIRRRWRCCAVINIGTHPISDNCIRRCRLVYTIMGGRKAVFESY